MSVITQDVETIRKKGEVNVSQKLVAAARQSGRSPISMWFDYRRLHKGRGKLRFYEYMMYELYDLSRWQEGERERFVSAHIHWPLVNQCNDRKWWAVTEDKWISAGLLERNGIPVPRSVAVIDRGRRLYPDLPKLSDAAGLRDFLRGAAFPLFVKNISGMWSAGAMRLMGCDTTHVQIDGRDPATYDQLADEILGDGAYLVQECLAPHSFFDGLTGATATVRCLNLIGADGLRVPHVMLKLPMGGNIADNFWRPGNLLARLDPESGEILSLVGSEAGVLHRHDRLPGHDRALVGERLPHWDSLRALNEKVALIHAPNRYGSTDIALTEDGPVVVEVNNGCAFELMQIATGKGFLTDDILGFFHGCGVKI